MSILNNKYQIINNKSRLRRGSALILAMVLTSLLAIVAVMFLISSRVDNISTSAIADNENLNHAVDTVIAQISENLSIDVFRGTIDPNQYADYPDPCNLWLASLEPYQSGLYYRWRQVSDIYGNLFPVSQNMIAEALPDYNNSINFRGTAADADGDGVGDSMWVQVQVRGQGITSSKGKPVFAAIRVIDNSAMLNINTGLKFDPCSANGSNLMQINFAALSQRGANGTLDTAALKLDNWRRGTELSALYEPNVIWQYGNPAGAFTPFDISDELKLRNRYILLNYNNPVKTRIGNLWDNVFDIGLEVPVQSITDPNNWFWRTNNLSTDPEVYDYRHIATTYNLDRIIDPVGEKMLNINYAPTIDPNFIRKKIADALVAGGALPADANVLGAQITANLIDYVDADSNVTVVDTGVPTAPYRFGFETPCIYISELVQSFFRPPSGPVAKSYAIELYKPYTTDPTPELGKWQLVISDPPSTVPVTWSGNSYFHVLWKTDVNAPLVPDVNADPNADFNALDVTFNGGAYIWLQRDVNSVFITVDEYIVPGIEPNSGWLVDSNDVNEAIHSIQRDITSHKCIRRLWENPLEGFLLPATLGTYNAFDAYVASASDPFYALPVQAHPANRPFTNVGQLSELFYANTYSYGGYLFLPPGGVIEPNLRIDLALPVYHRLFNYLTVIDPYDHVPDPNEARIKGRININTAPWFVLAQLPWVSYHTPNSNLARAIVNSRNTYGPFRSTGELMRVGIVNNDPNNLNRIDYYARDLNDLAALPDLTYRDLAVDDFEERDAIFARMSNLITVRSDVFTAYILVRVGKDGPQKRVIAILDRSGVIPIAGSYTGKVKVIAVQQVPDPR